MAPSRKAKKIFVLDTNVILHDSSCIRQFQEHDIVVPITVLEELDQFKKGNGILNFHAREFLRTLDALSATSSSTAGSASAPSRARISIKLDARVAPGPRGQLHGRQAGPSHPEHRRIAWRRQHPARPVILVTKDVNLRMKAKAIGLLAQDYTHRPGADVDLALHAATGRRGGARDAHPTPCTRRRPRPRRARLPAQPRLMPNEYVILRNGKHSALARYDADARDAASRRQGARPTASCRATPSRPSPSTPCSNDRSSW